MAAIAVTTRLSGQAVAVLKARAERAGLGPSAYASRMLEGALLGAELLHGPSTGVSPAARDALATELFFVGRALETLLENKPKLLKQAKDGARGQVHHLGLGDPDNPATSDEEQRALLDRVTGSRR
jgi:hypothetical protein